MIDLEPVLEATKPKHLRDRLVELYENAFPMVAGFVARRGGSVEEAKDIFHDSLVILYEKASTGTLFPNTTEERYLVGIAKHLWLRKCKEDKKMIAFDDLEKSISIPEDYFDSSNNRLLSLLELTGKKCLDLLRAYYYDSVPIKKIREVFGFSSTHSASVQKYKCIEKIRNTVHEKSLGYEDFA